MPARGLLCGVGDISSDSGISVRARGLLCGFSNSCADVGSPAPVRVLLCGFGKTLEVGRPILVYSVTFPTALADLSIPVLCDLWSVGLLGPSGPVVGCSLVAWSFDHLVLGLFFPPPPGYYVDFANFGQIWFLQCQFVVCSV